jgi:hypothetical protein
VQALQIGEIMGVCISIVSEKRVNAMQRSGCLGVLVPAVRELVAAVALFWASLLALFLRLLAQVLNMLSAALACLARIAGLLVRVALVAGVFAVCVRSGPLVWAAYGADVPALIPAVMVVALPLGAAFEFNPPLGRTWGAVAAWGAGVLVIGAIVDVADSITRSLLLVGVLTTITAYAQIQERSDEHL